MLKMNAVGLFVHDMARTVAFYRDVLGMTTDWHGEANAELYSDNAKLILFSRTMEIAFDVSTYVDVDREYARVTAAGAKPVFAPTTEPWGQRTCYVADPDGNLIEISSFQP